MTLIELKKEYGEHNVFSNQFELGNFVQEYGIRNKIKFICDRYPNERVARDNDILYDLAEYLLSENIAFFNDDYYIIEDLADLEKL